VTVTPRQSTDQNEAVSKKLTGQTIRVVRYFVLSVSDDQSPWQWDFGPWHAPTMGVELVTDSGETFSLIWAQCEDWGFGVDLFQRPMADYLIPEAAESWVDVSDHLSWKSIIGRPVEVNIQWNDYGTGRPPCADAVGLTTSAGTAWVITARSERRESTLKFRLGSDDLMVIFDDKFFEALGLLDPHRGRIQG
jgi:hypothetical protein